jgi:hypothetical protein
MLSLCCGTLKKTIGRGDGVVVIKGVVDRIEGEKVIVLLTDEGIVVNWPRQLLPGVQENDVLSFDVRLDVPAEEARKMSPKSLLECLAWHPDQ